MSFPETVEELEGFSQGFSEALEELKNSPGDFQQEFSIPQIPEDVMFFGDQMKAAAGGHLTFSEHQVTDMQDQMTQYNQLTSFPGDSSCRDETTILACQDPFHGYQTSGYGGQENLCVDPQMKRPFGGQPLNDWPPMQTTPGFDAIHHGNATNAAAGGHLTFSEHQVTDMQDQMTQYNQLTSFTGDSSCRDETTILACQDPFHGYQTSGYGGQENLCVDPQMTRPFGGHPLNDWPPMQTTPGFDTIHHGNATNFGEEWNMWNMCQDSGTAGNYEDTAYLGQSTIPEDVSILPEQKNFPDVEGSRGPQMTSFGNYTPYVDPCMCPSSSCVVESQPPKSSSVSPDVLGQLPQEKSELQIQSQVSKNCLPPLRLHSCPYQDCGKSYRKAFHLKHHMKKHTGEKPYECNEPGCSWKFYRMEDLKRHQTKHSGERPHPCAKCNRRFSRLCYLKQHHKICIQA